MKKEKSKKHVFLIGEDGWGYVAHTYDKNIANAFVSQYKKRKFIIKKTKNTTKLQQSLIDDNEIYEINDGKTQVFTTISDETYMSESLIQFKSDTEYSLQTFAENSSYLKLTDMEQKQLAVFRKYIFKMMVAEEETCDNENDYHEFFNYTKAMKYFIKHVLDGR